jgi:hypothetical protein
MQIFEDDYFSGFFVLPFFQKDRRNKKEIDEVGIKTTIY